MLKRSINRYKVAKKSSLFLGGVFDTLGLKILASKEAKKRLF